ncbi:AAA family ATPase [Acetivibrio ethanolgignens]|uniref:AAA domain-containing protein n=1 Tax=Acetivibrio ethanolgignens TaxID=290052 RepID=A0A0V8QCC2_9FIRM|nr:AAA family ATPase [Acetivibrio ethanolgignens]KSV58255.1 hypothetical protein ASU35_13410 [Acetivibrio ethanolgignens]
MSKETIGFEFKRDFYYELKNVVAKTNIIFLLGPRKCGKTVALLQLNQSTDKAEYHNFKILSKEESMEVFDSIKSAMKENLQRVFLLDEITYAHLPEQEINELAIQLSERPCHNTKVVFTGSQSVALEAWANRAFCGNASFVRVDFLRYSEWLSYKGIAESTEDSYNRFLYEVDEFYGFVSIEDYLRGCLEETVISNQKTSNCILGNESFLLDTNTLLDVCYATLFTLHNHVNSHGFAKKDKISDTIGFYFREVCRQLGADEVGNRIANSFVGRYNDFRTKDLETLKQAFLFLYRAGLITITPVSGSFESVPNIYMDLMSSDSKINYKDELFRSYNVCIRYPMFYIGILKDILKENLPERLPTALLGSIVECNVRGILPEKGSFEFKDEYGHEVDYVNLLNSIALEITVSNKRSNELNFQFLHEDYLCIALTRDFYEIKGNKQYLPYHRFIRSVTDNNQAARLRTLNKEMLIF